MKDGNYVIELADSVKEMFDEGTLDPSAEEIAAHHFAGKEISCEISEGVRRRLVKIKAVLKESLGLDVYLVNQRYYLEFRSKHPTTLAASHACVPDLKGITAFGIRLVTCDDDLVWKASNVRFSA